MITRSVRDRRPVDGPPDTVAAFAARHGLDLVRIAYLLCGDRQLAEDLVQEVLLSMHRRFPTALTLENPTAYARRALVNANISRTRRLSARELPLVEVPDRGRVDADGPERDALWQALRRLPERQRAALVLRYYVDLSDHDIADLLGCRRTTVRSLVARGLAALRADGGIDPDGDADA